MKRFVPSGISLPVELAKKIEKDRGDIGRSRYLLRIIEKAYREKESNENGVRTRVVS